MEAACGHSKIKEITWYENHGQSHKFMCLNCNTDFVQVTPEIRRFMWEQQWLPHQSVEEKWDSMVEDAHKPYGGLEKAHPTPLDGSCD